MNVRRLFFTLFFSAVSQLSGQGPYAPGPDMPGTTAIAATDSRIVAWATGVQKFEPGPVDIAEPAGARVTFGSPDAALGPSDATSEDPLPVLSLGDGGHLTVTFAEPVTDGPGPDFAVFENGFQDGFIELAYVEVSSDGQLFQRFPAVSLTPIESPLGSFGFIEVSDIHNLAGKYRVGFGTPFDLQDLVGLAPEEVDLARIRFVRIVDVVGSLDPAFAQLDSRGVPINDPYPTPFPSGGFDLDAVAVLNRLSEETPGAGPIDERIRREAESGTELVYEVRFREEPESGAYRVERSVDLAAWEPVDDEDVQRSGDRWRLPISSVTGATYFRVRRSLP